jgi:hypothetical protein
VVTSISAGPLLDKAFLRHRTKSDAELTALAAGRVLVVAEHRRADYEDDVVAVEQVADLSHCRGQYAAECRMPGRERGS